MSRPLISVLMAAHNADSFIQTAIKSVLDQTCKRFEFIVVDDASTDSTGECLAGMAKQDKRLRVLTNNSNIGLAASLNRAIDVAEGEFLARMDADDIALPHRLQRQVDTFAGEPGLVLLGSNAQQISRSGYALATTDLPLDDWTIRCVSLSLNPFVHPAVMMRANPFRGAGLRYNTGFETTQDWELWTQLMQYGRAANLREPLIEQRVHSGSVSICKRRLQLDNSLRIQESYVKRFLGSNAWERKRFSYMNEVFYGSRHDADSAGQDLVLACWVALDLLTVVESRYPSADCTRYRHFMVERCVRMGLLPPTRRGALGLARTLMLRYPRSTLRALARVVGGRVASAKKTRRNNEEVEI